MLRLSLFFNGQSFVSKLLYLLAWTVANVGGLNRCWRLCVFDWCACALQSVRCKYNLDHHWRLWRAYLSTRQEFARAVYIPPVTAILVPIRYNNVLPGVVAGGITELQTLFATALKTEPQGYRHIVNTNVR